METNQEIIHSFSKYILTLCPHPNEHVVTMLPSTTGGKQECLLCRKTRYQNRKDGSWMEWK